VENAYIQAFHPSGNTNITRLIKRKPERYPLCESVII